MSSSLPLLETTDQNDNIIIYSTQNPFEYNIDPYYRDDRMRTPLHTASTSEQCLWLLYSRADVNSQDEYGNTPLHLYCQNDQYNSVYILLEYNANMHITDSSMSTPLHWAASRSSQCMSLLIDNNANIEAINKYKDRPIHSAVQNNDIIPLSLLLQCKAYVDPVNEYMYTPLYFAVILDKYNHVALLLQYHANIHLNITNNKTPLSYAKMAKKKDIYKLMLTYIDDNNN